MPKKVDHEQRRHAIAEAVWRLAAGHGLEAVSLNEVAAEAGVSKGMVQHYFATRDDLVRYAARRAGQRRCARVLRDVPDPDTPLDLLRTALAAFLPTDPESRADVLLENAFLIRSVTDERLAVEVRRIHEQTVGVLAHLLAAARDAGHLHPDTAPDLEAPRLLALTTGLATHLLLGHLDAAAALATLDHHLDLLAPARPLVKDAR